MGRRRRKERPRHQLLTRFGACGPDGCHNMLSLWLDEALAGLFLLEGREKINAHASFSVSVWWIIIPLPCVFSPEEKNSGKKNPASLISWFQQMHFFFLFFSFFFFFSDRCASDKVDVGSRDSIRPQSSDRLQIVSELIIINRQTGFHLQFFSFFSFKGEEQKVPPLFFKCSRSC